MLRRLVFTSKSELARVEEFSDATSAHSRSSHATAVGRSPGCSRNIPETICALSGAATEKAPFASASESESATSSSLLGVDAAASSNARRSPPPDVCAVVVVAPSRASSSSIASAVSSHAVPVMAEQTASLPSESTAANASPGGSSPSPGASSGGSQARSATGAGKRTTAAHIGGGCAPLAAGVTLTNSPSTTATVPAGDASTSHPKTNSSTPPAAVNTRSAYRESSPVTSQVRGSEWSIAPHCTLVSAPSLASYLSSRFRSHFALPRL